MNNEIPPRITSAPTAIAIAFVLLRPLLPDVLVFRLVIVGVEDVVVAVDCGTPGVNGLAGPWARAAGAAPSAQPASTVASAARPVADMRVPSTYRSDASGCSIAGVSGASR
jgi:hypothetical protein